MELPSKASGSGSPSLVSQESLGIGVTGSDSVSGASSITTFAFGANAPVLTFEKWDQSESDAVALWSTMVGHFKGAAKVYADTLQYGSKNPKKFAQFLKFVSPTARIILESHNKKKKIKTQHVLNAYATAVFAEIQPDLMRARGCYINGALNMAESQQNIPSTNRAIRECLALLHILLFTYQSSGMFDNFIHAIRVFNNQQFVKEFCIPPPNFFQVERGFPFQLPFDLWRTFLCVFGISNRGNYCSETGVEDQISIPKMLEAMQAIDCFFQDKNDTIYNTQPTMTKEEAMVISKDVYGLPELFWRIENKLGVLRYFNVVKQIGVDNVMKLPSDLTAEQFLKQFKDGLEDTVVLTGQFSDDGIPEGEVPVCTGYSLSASTKKVKDKKTFDFKRSPRLACIREATQKVLAGWNRDGRPLDEQLETGVAIREKFCLENNNPDARSKMKAKLIPLGQGDAPCVVHFAHALSPEFNDLDVTITDDIALVMDTHGDANTSSVGSFFNCKLCATNNNEFMGPHMKLGAKNSLVSKPASEYQQMKNAFASQIVNTILDAANLLMHKAFKLPEQPCLGSVNLGSLDATNDKSEVNWAARAEQVKKLQPPLTTSLDAKQLDASVAKLKSNKYNTAELTGIRYFPRQVINADIVKVGPQPTYSYHQDAGHTLVSPPSDLRNCTANGDVLPVQGDFPVITFITGTGRVRSKVEWSYDKKITLAHIFTELGSVHLQLCGANDRRIVHQSFTVQNGGEAQKSKQPVKSGG